MVFVIWQLSTQKKDFIPRVGSPIIGIHTTPDHSIYAVRCADNSIRLISTRSRNLLVSIQGIKYGMIRRSYQWDSQVFFFLIGLH